VKGSQKEEESMVETSRMKRNILSIHDTEKANYISEAQLVDEYSSIVYRFCLSLSYRKEDADDLFQDTYMRALTETPSSELLSKVKYNTINERPHVKTYYRSRRIIAIATVIATMIALSTIAIATNLFGVRDIAIPGTDDIIYHEWPDGTVVEYPRQLISMQGFAGSPEHATIVEWFEVLETYDLDALLAIIGNTENEEIPEPYRLSGAYSLEMTYKLNEILDKYDLVLRGKILPLEYDGFVLSESMTQGTLFNESIAYGILFNDDSMRYYGDKFENGSFWLEGYGDNEILMSMHANRKGVFNGDFINIGDIDDHIEWNYRNAYGSQILLVQNDYHSLMFLDTEEFFITVGLSAGAKGSSWQESVPPFGRSDLESYADIIDFGQIRTDLPDLIRHEFPASITQERIEQERNQVMAKRAELNAERTTNSAVMSDFVGMWSYVGSEDSNGAALPMFYKEGLMIDEDLRAYFWNGKGVLEQHLRLENPDPNPEDRFFIGHMKMVGNGEYQVSVGGFWNYTVEEISFETADWDSMRLTYDTEKRLIKFTDWNGVHHFYKK